MTDIYQTTRDKEKTQAELATSAKALIENDIDMIICEVIFHSRNCRKILTNIFLVFPQRRRMRMGDRIVQRQRQTSGRNPLCRSKW